MNGNECFVEILDSSFPFHNSHVWSDKKAGWAATISLICLTNNLRLENLEKRSEWSVNVIELLDFLRIFIFLFTRSLVITLRIAYGWKIRDQNTFRRCFGTSNINHRAWDALKSRVSINHRQFRGSKHAQEAQRCKISQVFTIYEVQHNGF